MFKKIPFFSITLASLSIFLTGCYTQLQNLDYSEPRRGIHADYYTWEDSPSTRKVSDNYTTSDTERVEASAATRAPEKDYTNVQEEDSLANSPAIDVYYKDYETEQWYDDHYVNEMYWKGYDDGFADGYDEAYDDFWWETRGFYSLRRPHYRNFRYQWMGYYGYQWGFGFNYHHDMYWAGFRYPHWNYIDPWYDSFWGWGYYHSPYRAIVVVYNDYYRFNDNKRASRHLNGPRSTGLISRGNGITGTPRDRRTSDITTNRITTKRRGTTDLLGRTGRTQTGSSTIRTPRSGNTSTGRYTGRTGTSRSGSSGTIGRSRSNEPSVSTPRSRNSGSSVKRSGSSRSRGSGVTNRSRSTSNSGTVRSNSGSRSRSAGTVRSTNRSGSSRSSSAVRSNSGSRSSGSAVRGSSSRSGSSSSVRSSTGSRKSSSSGSSGSSRSRSRNDG